MKVHKRSGSFYNTLLAHMNKQYKDVQVIVKAFLNDDRKVFAAEWIDSNGVFNICSGAYPDIAEEIVFED